MTVSAYVGEPGSGKSSNVVEHVIIPALKAGRTIFHNLELYEAPLRVLAGDGGKLIAFDKDTATPAWIVENCPGGALCVLDESWRYWRAGLKSSQVPEPEFKFFAEHRHRVDADKRAMDIVVIAQDLQTGCAAFIRALIAVTYHSVSLEVFGVKARYRIDIYKGPVTGPSPPVSKLVRSIMVKRNTAIFNCYKSHTKSETGEAGIEEAADKRANIWKSWTVIAAGCAIPLLVVCIVRIVWMFGGHGIERAATGTAKRSAAVPVAPAEPGAPPVAVSPPKPAVPAVVPWSSAWRLAGVIRHGLLQYAVVEGAGGGRLVSVSACQFDGAGNRVCLVDGQRVAEWTGPPPPAFTQWVQGSLASKTD